MASKSKHRLPGELDAANLGSIIPKRYLRLLAKFRLRPITSDQELEEAELVAGELDDHDDLSPEEEQYLDVLCRLIEAYEDEHHPIPDVSAGEMLRFLIEQRRVTQQTVSRETGIANSTITALVKGQREMTRKHIETFARYFGAQPAVFLPGKGPTTAPEAAGRVKMAPAVQAKRVRYSRR
jgi:HTH-type transcriptional regulator/antitoxin HigA